MRFFAVLLAAFLLFPPAAFAQEPYDAGSVVRQAVEGFIRPGYRAFSASTGALKSSLGALCETPSTDALDWARERFREAARTYFEIELIRFGPVTEKNRLERILFWPDRKGAGLRQVQGMIASKDASAADPVQLAGKSVAVQGFAALEFVLFGTGAEALASPVEPFRCGLGRAIAGNLDAIASDLAAGWDDPDGFSRRWMEPGAGNALYRDQQEALTELLDVFVHGLEQIRDVRLGGFLGKEAAGDKPKLALYWRSELTVPALRGNLVSLRALYFSSGLGGLLKPDEGWIGDQIAFELDNAIEALAGLDGPVADILGDEAKREKLAYVRIVTSSLSEDFGVRLAGALGLTAGFSSLDGD